MQNAKLKLVELSSVVENAKYIIEESNVPIKLAYKLTKLYKKLNTELEQLEETRIKLITKYAEKDEDGNVKQNEDNSVPIMKDKLNEFQTEVNDLFSMEIDIEFEPINIDDFGDINISPKHLIGLDIFIIE